MTAAGGDPERPRRRRLRALRRVALVVLATVLAVFALTAFRVWGVAREDHRDRVDAIVVLGAAQFDGRPSQVFEARLRHAHALYDERVAPRIVTVGGARPGDRFSEAAAGARWLREHGVPAAAITEVPEGRDTVTSLRAAAKDLTGVARVVLVTDPWHGLRARQIATDLGFRAKTSPARTGPVVRTRATQVRYIARETLAYLHYRVFKRGAGRGPRAV